MTQWVTFAQNRLPTQYTRDGLILQNSFPHSHIYFGKVGPEFVLIIQEMTANHDRLAPPRGGGYCGSSSAGA